MAKYSEVVVGSQLSSDAAADAPLEECWTKLQTMHTLLFANLTDWSIVRICHAGTDQQNFET